MDVKPRILFVSHAATRNGATILLLNTLRWLHERDEFRIEVLVSGSGALLDEFRRVGRTMVWHNPARLLAPLPRRLRLRAEMTIEALISRVLLGRHYDLVYLNTAAVWRFAPLLAKRSRHILWHIHELDYSLRLNIGESQIRRLFPLASRFVVVSQAVQEVLNRNFGVAADRMDLVHGFVDAPTFNPSDRMDCRKRLLDALGWPADSFVIGACGAMGWCKGTDLFLQIARSMHQFEVDSPIRFLWVGGKAEGDEALRFEHDRQLFELTQYCASVPTTANVSDYFKAMDVFALTSREDAFPLVMLEAGAFQLPTVCFQATGGGPEFVADDAGLVAPYLDLPGFARHLETLRGDPELRQQMGNAAARKVRTHHVVESQGPKILSAIKRSLLSTGEKSQSETL